MYDRIPGCVLPMFEIGTDRLKAVHSVDGKHAQNTEVGNQDGPVKPRQLMDSRECIVKNPARDPIKGGGDEKQRQWMKNMHIGQRSNGIIFTLDRARDNYASTL